MHPITAAHDALRAMLLGKTLHQVPTPAAVIDRAVVRRNCSQMLDACHGLGVTFRPHVKTHKTAEITHLQVGVDSKSVNIIVSTVAEAEWLVEPYLKPCRKAGRVINILYGVPLPPSQARRLGALGKELGVGSISVMIDHVDHLQPLQDFQCAAGFNADIFIKVDCGYGRAGLPPHSHAFRVLLKTVLIAEARGGIGRLRGFYSHAGHSYGVDSPVAAMSHLAQELESLTSASSLAQDILQVERMSTAEPCYILSVGATPSATSIQHLTENHQHTKELEAESFRLRSCIKRAKVSNTVELHAGVYPLLDMQQLATQASPSACGSLSTHATNNISYSDLALTILVEAVSLYEHRTPPEVLVAAGSLALGREPCKSYDGWGVVSNWGMSSMPSSGHLSGWEVARVSQEHGVLHSLSQGVSGDTVGLKMGQKLRIWPNHACVAGAGFDFYLIVDSDLASECRDEVVDLWFRCRGW